MEREREIKCSGAEGEKWGCWGERFPAHCTCLRGTVALRMSVAVGYDGTHASLWLSSGSGSLVTC